MGILHILNYSFLQEFANVIENVISRIVLARVLGNMLIGVNQALFGALSDHNHTVTLLFHTL